MTATWVELAAALASASDLDGAACTGKSWLFDPPDSESGERTAETAERHRMAKKLCDSCPVFDDCSAWAETLNPGEVSGVLAGESYKPPTRSLPPYRRKTVA